MKSVIKHIIIIIAICIYIAPMQLKAKSCCQSMTNKKITMHKHNLHSHKKNNSLRFRTVCPCTEKNCNLNTKNNNVVLYILNNSNDLKIAKSVINHKKFLSNISYYQNGVANAPPDLAYLERKNQSLYLLIQQFLI